LLLFSPPICRDFVLHVRIHHSGIGIAAIRPKDFSFGLTDPKVSCFPRALPPSRFCDSMITYEALKTTTLMTLRPPGSNAFSFFGIGRHGSTRYPHVFFYSRRSLPLHFPALVLSLYHRNMAPSETGRCPSVRNFIPARRPVSMIYVSPPRKCVDGRSFFVYPFSLLTTI